MPVRPALLVAALAAGAAGCAMPQPQPSVQFATAAAPIPATPRLIPLDGALPDPQAGAPVAAAGTQTADLGASLRRRGAAMQGPVISPGERRRLEAAIARARAAAGD